MKPFDLEEALAGKPVVTRVGSTVNQIVKFDVIENPYCIAGVVHGNIETWFINGKYSPNKHESNFDLFMATESKFIWINLWQQLHENGNYVTTVHTREDLADLEIENNVTLKHIQKLTIIQ
jgi:hypothetical protein